MNHTRLTYKENYQTLGQSLKVFYDKMILTNTGRVLEEALSHIDETFPELLRFIILADALKSVERSVHNSCTPLEMESFEYIMYCLYDYSQMPFNDWRQSAEVKDSFPKMVESLREAFPYNDDSFGAFQLVKFLSECGCNDIAEEYFNNMYELAKCVTYADGRVTQMESVWIEILDFYKPIIHSRAQITIMSNSISTNDGEADEEEDYSVNYISDDDSLEDDDDFSDTNIADDEEEIRNPLEELQELIGLEPVKTDVKSLRNLLHMQQLRASKGMKAAKVSYHCVFMGNPGTGKTTVARILARIYKDLGILKSGHLIETDRSGLVADYVGQTATKTNAIIDKALDGVLFIDEAYALAQGGDQDFGREAISTLLKRMEDDRKRLVVILAGYSKEMEEFINTNSGLQSRFSRYITFPDYEIGELCDIFRLFLKQNDYTITKKGMMKVESVISDAYNNKDYRFGNARYVRNLFESIITNQANRLAEKNNISMDEMAEIKDDDI